MQCVVLFDVIKSWKNTSSKKLANGFKVRGFTSLDRELLSKRFAVLNAATASKDIPLLKALSFVL